MITVLSFDLYDKIKDALAAPWKLSFCPIALIAWKITEPT